MADIPGAADRAPDGAPSSTPARTEGLTLTTDDGVPLSARWWGGAQASERTVVCLSGLAAPQDYLRFFAGFLAQRGWGVLTFDYRGIGGSRAAGPRGSLDDWVEHDVPAAIAEAKRRSGGAGFLGAFAHSIGGQLLGQNPARGELHGALLLAAQRGIPNLYSGAGYWRVHYAYTLFPLLIHLLGRLPVTPWTLPQPCPGPALLQWVRWGRQGVFTNQRGENVEPRFRQWRGPVVAVDISDDDYAPRPAVDALARLYPIEFVRRETLTPADFGVEEIGHFGFFHPRAPRQLWGRAEAWLRDLVPGPDPSARP